MKIVYFELLSILYIGIDCKSQFVHPLEVAIFLTEGNLITLNKPTKETFAILLLGETLYHLSWKCLCAALSSTSKMESSFELYQFGVAFPCDTERIARGLSACIEQHRSLDDLCVEGGYD